MRLWTRSRHSAEAHRTEHLSISGFERMRKRFLFCKRPKHGLLCRRGIHRAFHPAGINELRFVLLPVGAGQNVELFGR